jgi:hypothetical protein
MSNTTTAPIAQDRETLIKRITAHIGKGEKAKERAEQATEKAEQHYIAAGLCLIELKEKHTTNTEQWESLLKTVGISTGRASTLMQIADGHKTLKQVRASNAAANKRLRDRRLHHRDEEPTAAAPPEPTPVKKSGWFAMSDLMAAWDAADLDTRRRFIDAVGFNVLIKAVPPAWRQKLAETARLIRRSRPSRIPAAEQVPA